MLHQNLKMAIRFKRGKDEIPKYLTKISSGKKILNIVEGVNAYSFDNDEINSKDEAKLIEDFFRIINDSKYIDEKLDSEERTGMVFDLSEIIKELDELGFWVFGVRKEEIFQDNGKEVTLSMAIFNIIRKTNDRIIKVSKKYEK